MDNNIKELWENLHKDSRFRPKYPSEVVVQYVFRNFTRDGKSKILDLGCGTGRHVFFMANENIDVCGVDISLDGVENTKKILNYNNLRGDIKVGSADAIPYDDEIFDGLICYGVLYYCSIEEIKKSIDEIYRVLKKNGKALIVVRTVEDYRYGCGKEIEKNTFLIYERDINKCSFNENGMVMHFFTKEEVIDLLKDFDYVSIDTIEETNENGKYKDSNFIIHIIK